MGCAESRDGAELVAADKARRPAAQQRNSGVLLALLPAKWAAAVRRQPSEPPAYSPATATSNGSAAHDGAAPSTTIAVPQIVVMDPEMTDLMSSVANAAAAAAAAAMYNEEEEEESEDMLSADHDHQYEHDVAVVRRMPSDVSVEARSLGGGSSTTSTKERERTVHSILRRFPFPTTGRCSPRNRIKIIKTVTWRRDNNNINNNQPLRSYSTATSAATSASASHKQTAPLCQRLDPVMLHTQHALNFMVMKSVETAVPVVVPLERWLQDRLSSWVQLSGHDGMIVPASDSTLWKKRASNDSYEAATYIKLMDDVLCPFVAKFYREVEYQNSLFIEIEDLTRHFTNPAIMDIKIGTRTFLESEVRNPVKRHDLYKKMINIDPAEPTADEHAEKAITKLRYMQFRERESSTAEFGFRIEAIKTQKGVTEKDFKRVKSIDQISEVLVGFLDQATKKTRTTFIRRLKLLRTKMEQSMMFRTHELIGSSLLFMYDQKHANVWMIDFAKVCPAEGMLLDHRSPWSLGNHEDGYLFGLDYLIKILEECKLNGPKGRGGRRRPRDVTHKI